MGQAKIPMVSSLRALATLAVLSAVSWELGSATSEVDTTDVISDVAQLLSKNPNIQDDADDGSIAQIKQALSSEKASQEEVTNPKEDAAWTDETKEDTTNLDQNDAPEEDMLGDVTVPTQLPVVVLDFGADADAHHTDADADVAEQHADADTPYGADADVQITVADVQITVVGALSITGADAQHVAGAQPVAGARAQLARRRIEGRSR